MVYYVLRRNQIGLLNKFLDGLDRLKERKNFSSAKGSDEVKNMWIRKSNSVMAFSFEKAEDDYESYVSKKDFRKRYAMYCVNDGQIVHRV